VQAFAGRYPANRYLATCRVLSYQPPQTPQEPDLRLAGFPSFELAFFDADKIERFIQAWYQELARLGTVPGEDAPGLTRRLKEAVRRPDLWRLAANPLLLTVMALVRGTLPPEQFTGQREIVKVDGIDAVLAPVSDDHWVVAWYETDDRCDLYTLVLYPPVDVDQAREVVAGLDRVGN